MGSQVEKQSFHVHTQLHNTAMCHIAAQEHSLRVIVMYEDMYTHPLVEVAEYNSY